MKKSTNATRRTNATAARCSGPACPTRADLGPQQVLSPSVAARAAAALCVCARPSTD